MALPHRGARAEVAVAEGIPAAPARPRETKRWRNLHRGRSAVEREFGRLKNEYGLAPLRVRGLAKVALHADLVMLARLSRPSSGPEPSRSRRSGSRSSRCQFQPLARRANRAHASTKANHATTMK